MSELLEALRLRAEELGAAAAASTEGGLEGLDEDQAARRALALLAEAGLLAWTVPAAHGGADAQDLCPPDQVSVRALVTLRSSLAWHSGMLDVMFVMQGLGSYAIARAGNEALRREILPDVVAGRRIAAFALTEPEAGSDLGSIVTRAERADPGGWRLSGAKTFISNAGLADVYTVVARTSGEPGDGGRDSLTAFAMAGDAAGLEALRFEVMAPHPIGELRLEGVELADDRRLGEIGGGLELALQTLGRFRTSVAGAACGFARRALAESLEHLGTRRQFGRPLASFQGLRFDLAEMDARLRAAELLVDEAAAAVDCGERAVAEVARAKLMATETAGWVADRAVQHLGGRGVRRGEIVERLYREVRALRIYEGTSEVQRLILARELLGAHG